MENKLLNLSAVGYRVGDKQILETVDFALNAEEIVTIVGPNGAGKTTLLSIALGLIKPTSGQVSRRSPDEQALRIGYVPQLVNRDSTLPLNVREFLGLSKSRPRAVVIEQLLDDLGLSPLAKTFLSELSGGELRRVLFARALLNRPHLLVLDEPTAGVDAVGQTAFYQQLNGLRERYRFTILMVSHDLHWVMSATDRVICLNKHICCQGEPSYVINHPNYRALFECEQDSISNHLPKLAFYQQPKQQAKQQTETSA